MMRKTYEKPVIMFENFAVNAHIAGDCEKIVGNPSKGSCAVSGTGGINVFTSEIGACVFTPTDIGNNHNDMYDGACYHLPDPYNSLFNS